MGDLKNLGKYSLQSVLGQGAMGVVYKGFDPNIERTVAIKTIRKGNFDPKEMKPLLARFKREAQAAGRLTHPGIVTVYDYGEEDDTAYIAMEFVHGRELKDFLDNNERFSVSKAVNIISQLLDALAYSHAQGVVHRDIKPGNILLLNNEKIKVMDFGIARIESSTLTQFGDVIGTPSYMSPEQFSGQLVDKRTDLFSTGVILYHLLTGEKPFPGNSLTTIMHRVINTAPLRVSDLNFQIPSFLDDVVLKALDKKPGQRFQTAEEFKANLTKSSPPLEVTPVTEHHRNIDNGSEPTVNIPAEAITIASREAETVGNHVELQQKFDKIVNLLESQAIGSNEAEKKLYAKGRSWVITILTLIILTLSGYSVWTIYSEDLTYDEFEQIAIDNIEEISLLFSARQANVVEISQSLKSKPTREFPETPDPRESKTGASTNPPTSETANNHPQEK